MTSRRKAKRAPWVEVKDNWFVAHRDGTREPFAFTWPWYMRDRLRHLDRRHAAEVSPMYGCVKRAVQDRRGRGGSWNGHGIDPGYRAGFISWNRHDEG